MFTGIIEEVGTLTDVAHQGGGRKFSIYAPDSALELNVDQSVAVNGVCFTVVSKSEDEFQVDAVEETLLKTTMGSVEIGDHVNLELPLKMQERLHGHLVLGHVDAVGRITGVESHGLETMLTVEVAKEFEKYLVRVGSIAVDGISLTLARILDNGFQVAIIPHTMENTICKFYAVDDHVNLEFDIIGKYVDRMMKAYEPPPAGGKFYSREELKDMGY